LIYSNIYSFYKRLNFNFFKAGYTSIFYLTLPCRQHWFSMLNFYTKDVHISVGCILSYVGYVAKFFKKSSANHNIILDFFKKFYGTNLAWIYLFSIINFNYKQYIFFLKFFKQLNPMILYFIHKHSFIPHFCPKRRIKRQVLRAVLHDN
jgi:hypothetical protein